MRSMSKRRGYKFFWSILVVILVFTSLGASNYTVNAEYNPQEQQDVSVILEPASSSENPAESDPLPVIIETIDPNQTMQGVHIPQDEEIKNAIAGASAPVSTIVIDYYPSGAIYSYPEVTCDTVPETVKVSLLAAAAVWAQIVQSLVPINIAVCWGNANSDTVLSYVYSEKSTQRDFAGAPLTDTWYPPVLAEALHGSELDAPGAADIELMVNSSIPWYLGTDANPSSDTYDLMTVVIHSIGHQLGILSGVYSGGSGYNNSVNGSPFVYDTFLEDGSGTKMISFANQSTGLTAAVTSNDLWFNGAKSFAANGGNRVKAYAPTTWDDQLSLEHLDFDTFSGTTESLMVPTFALGYAQHNVGPILKGMLQDLGWKVGPVLIPLPIAPSGRINGYTPTYKWKKVNNSTQYEFRVYKGTSTTPVYTKTVPSTACGALYCQNKPTTALKLGLHKWQVRANIGGSWKPWSAKMVFTVAEPLAGFNSPFDENANGWSPVRGTWSVSNGSYKTSGLRNQISSSQRLDVYGVYTYTVKMRNSGCSSCGYGIYFNGKINFITQTGNWSDGYLFMVNNDGGFNIVMLENGNSTSLTGGWPKYSGITSSWNTLQVTYNKNSGFVQFFINGQRIARGTFNKFTSGVVGVMGYRNDTETSSPAITNAELIMSAPASASLRSDSAVLFDFLTDESGIETTLFEDIQIE